MNVSIPRYLKFGKALIFDVSTGHRKIAQGQQSSVEDPKRLQFFANIPATKNAFDYKKCSFTCLKRTTKHSRVDLKEHYKSVGKGFPDEVTRLSPFSKVRKNLEKIRASLPPPNDEEREEKEGGEEESKDGKCPICQEAMKNIIMVLNCGHGVCPSCYKGLLNSKKTCHMCRTVIDKTKFPVPKIMTLG